MRLGRNLWQVSLIRKKHKSERRKWQRLPLAIPVFVHGVDETGQRFVEFATALNISAGGAQLAIRRFLAPTSRISIEIPCSVGPYRATPTQVKSNLLARIMSNQPAKNGEPYHLLGLKFHQPLLASKTKPGKKRIESKSRASHA
jgi:hypothetical protein